MRMCLHYVVKVLDGIFRTRESNLLTGSLLEQEAVL